MLLRSFVVGDWQESHDRPQSDPGTTEFIGFVAQREFAGVRAEGPKMIRKDRTGLSCSTVPPFRPALP